MRFSSSFSFSSCCRQIFSVPVIDREGKTATNQNRKTKDPEPNQRIETNCDSNWRIFQSKELNIRQKTTKRRRKNKMEFDLFRIQGYAICTTRSYQNKKTYFLTERRIFFFWKNAPNIFSNAPMVHRNRRYESMYHPSQESIDSSHTMLLPLSISINLR